MTGKSKSKAKSKPAKKAPIKKTTKAPKAKTKPKVKDHETGVQSITGEIAHSLYITAQTDLEGKPTGGVQVLLKSDSACLGFIAFDELVWSQIVSHLNEAITIARSLKPQSQIAAVQ